MAEQEPRVLGDRYEIHQRLARGGMAQVYLARDQALDRPVAVKILFPNAADRGTHVNISGMALAKNAPNKAAALKLMEFLGSDEAQLLYAEANNEYPVNPRIAPSAVVASWGKLKPDALPLASIAKFRKRASELMDKVGFDGGPGS